ncbi:UNVERIFIED_CONTAM: hypothetical protein FKN15_027061 [Acipenser sinensis]
MEAVGKFDFNATAEDELSFRKGDILKGKRGSLEERFGGALNPPTQRRQSEIPITHQSSGGVRVRGLYDFIAEESDELGFRAGDVIEVLDQSDSAWWRGRLRGQTGLFPSNYITPL